MRGAGNVLKRQRLKGRNKNNRFIINIVENREEGVAPLFVRERLLQILSQKSRSTNLFKDKSWSVP